MTNIDDMINTRQRARPGFKDDEPEAFQKSPVDVVTLDGWVPSAIMQEKSDYGTPAELKAKIKDMFAALKEATSPEEWNQVLMELDPEYFGTPRTDKAGNRTDIQAKVNAPLPGDGTPEEKDEVAINYRGDLNAPVAGKPGEGFLNRDILSKEEFESQAQEPEEDPYGTAATRHTASYARRTRDDWAARKAAQKEAEGDGAAADAAEKPAGAGEPRQGRGSRRKAKAEAEASKE